MKLCSSDNHYTMAPPKNMVPPTNQQVSNMNISSGRDNEEIIKDGIRRSKRKYFHDARSCYGKVSNANSSPRKPSFDKSFIFLGYLYLEMAFFLPQEKSLKNQVVLIFWMNVKFWQNGQLIWFGKEKVTNYVKGCMGFRPYF